MKVPGLQSGRLTTSFIGLALILCIGFVAVTSAVRSPVPIDDSPYPLFGMILDFDETHPDYTCNVPLGFLTGLITRNLSAPIKPTFDLPFPNAGDFVDGVVTLDVQNRIIFTYITSLSPGVDGGWLIGMKLYALEYEGKFYTDGGLLFVTPLSDTALYGIDFDDGTGQIVGWTAKEDKSSNWNSALLSINYKNGNITTLLSAPNTIPTTSSYIANGTHYSMVYGYKDDTLTSATVYGINVRTGSVDLQLNIQLDAQLLFTARWIYNTANNMVYTTFYNETEDSYDLAMIDTANQFSVVSIGGGLLEKSESSGTFSLNTRTDLAYLITESINPNNDHVNAWLIVANSTTGQLIERRNLTENLVMFLTYVPWIDLDV